MNRRSLAILLSLVAASSPLLAAEEPSSPRAESAPALSLPLGFEPATSNATGRTWRQTGSLPQPFAMARATLRASMLGQGYTLVHDIAESDNATRRLQLWRHAGGDVILMLWQQDLSTTGLACGVSPRDGSAPDSSVSPSLRPHPPTP